jgi:hypothetical protein
MVASILHKSNMGELVFQEIEQTDEEEEDDEDSSEDDTSQRSDVEKAIESA